MIRWFGLLSIAVVFILALAGCIPAPDPDPVDTTGPKWEVYARGTWRLRVDGGYIYEAGRGLVFVPDVKGAQ